MEVNLTPEQEARLRTAAQRAGRDARELVAAALVRFPADEGRKPGELRAAIDKGDADMG